MMLSSQSNAELIQLVCELSEIQSMRATVSSCISSGAIVGVAAALGGLLFGPRGIAVGSIFAGVATSAVSEGKFRSVPDILRNDLTKDQQNKLTDSIRNILNERNIMTAAAFTMGLMTEGGLKETVISIVRNFLVQELSYSI